MSKLLVTEYCEKTAAAAHGLSAQELHQRATDALEHGLRASVGTDKTLWRYFVRLHLRHPSSNLSRIFGGLVFLYKDNLLVTVFKCPRHIWALAEPYLVDQESEQEQQTHTGQDNDALR